MRPRLESARAGISATTFFSRAAVSILAASVLTLGVEEARVEDGAVAEPRQEGKALFKRVVGNPDSSILRRISAAFPTQRLVESIYEGSRTERLIALEAAAYSRDPWPMLPYLAALMGARDRGSASRAAHALIEGLSTSLSRPDRYYDVVPGQAAQLAEQLGEIAKDQRLDADIRASAVQGIALLKALNGNVSARMRELMFDDEIEVRRAAFSLVTPPVSDELLKDLAKMVDRDPDKGLRAQAAALLCENALAHGVKTPSSDLTAMLKRVLGDPGTPGEGAAAVLSCIANFERASSADLIDLALKNPDPEVRQMWEGRDR